MLFFPKADSEAVPLILKPLHVNINIINNQPVCIFPCSICWQTVCVTPKTTFLSARKICWASGSWSSPVFSYSTLEFSHFVFCETIDSENETGWSSTWFISSGCPWSSISFRIEGGFISQFQYTSSPPNNHASDCPWVMNATVLLELLWWTDPTWLP